MRTLRNWIALLLAAVWFSPQLCNGQNYTRQIPSDPDSGSILGVHQYGRQLKTDPDKGEGFTHHVYPPGEWWGARGELPEAQGAQAMVRAPGAPQQHRALPHDATHGLVKARVPAKPDLTDDADKRRPLIQIKVRVVEVQRNDDLQVSSVLDYISSNPATAKGSFVTGNNLNANKQNLTSLSRFPVPLDTALKGSGMLFNLTEQHINWIASILQTEFHSDLVTAPEVVTLDGENVEFVSGAKFPFQLGNNVVNGNNNNVQQFFYKHVGAFVSITPTVIEVGKDNEAKKLIQLEIVVRTSDSGTETVKILDEAKNVKEQDLKFEDHVRAVANVIRIENGHGLVMAGLIGEHDVRSVAKVPVLGDLPIAGALFRSKTTDRIKTETLVFVEAKILCDYACSARADSYEDFRLGDAYVSGELLDNPLEEGLHRAGMGSYLPPYSCDEARFWEKMGRKVQRVVTAVDDSAQ